VASHTTGGVTVERRQIRSEVERVDLHVRIVCIYIDSLLPMPDTSGFYGARTSQPEGIKGLSIMYSPRKSHNNLGKVSGSLTENCPNLFQSNFSNLHGPNAITPDSQYNPGALNSSTLTRLRFICEKSFIIVNTR
jgi:hypothetical protein